MHPIISALGRHARGSTGCAGRAATRLRPRPSSPPSRRCARHDPHVVFLCSPNNPTGTALGLDVVEAVSCRRGARLVVVDEAYAEFARPGTPSALTLLAGRPRLVVTRTMSKAFAFAGGRLGYLAADPALVDALRLVRLPYHLSAPTQAIALAALRHAPSHARHGRGDQGAARPDRRRARASSGSTRSPSDANFVLFGGLDDAAQTWRDAARPGRAGPRRRHPALSSCHGRDPGGDRRVPRRHGAGRPT